MSPYPFPWFLSYPAAFAGLALALILNVWSFGHALLMGFQVLLLFVAALWLVLGLPYVQGRYREKKTRFRTAFSRMQDEGLSEEEREKILKKEGGEKETSVNAAADTASDNTVRKPDFHGTSRSGQSQLSQELDPGDWLEDALSKEISPVPVQEKKGAAKPEEEAPLLSGQEDAILFQGSEDGQEKEVDQAASVPESSGTDQRRGLEALAVPLVVIREILEKEAPVSVDMAEVFCLQEGYGLNQALGEINMAAEESLGHRLFQVRGEVVEKI
ncbi:hypothetical protein [Desulfobotulus mexicanus]|uniref:Uncharacterized protein n=1 Tax=Desulfobotulus mexicanus TaxID=2586642 RepID=A0A5Q4VH99_9BACT|nr:hypothetical protein [Desulfobotulus mexicanus]TYT76216.1 hypothetical protein FIM25_01295 [Desulfobotulus mexicanus]